MKIKIKSKDWYDKCKDENGDVKDHHGVVVMNEEMSNYCGKLLDVYSSFESPHYGLLYTCRDNLFYWSPMVCEFAFEYEVPKLFHPKVGESLFWSLIEKYEKYGTLYIGVDFDNTLKPYKEDFETADAGYGQIVTLLKECKQLGFKLCLWSLCDSGEDLVWKVDWCSKMGIYVDYINESPLLKEMTEKSKGHKPYFNLMLDDTAGLDGAYSVLWNVVRFLSVQKKW